MGFTLFIRMKSTNYLTLVLLCILQFVRPAVAANGTCISSPESSCTTLVALCVNKVASGQVASNNFWSVPECFTGATCAGSAAVLDAACCAGTCMTLPDMNSLNYNKVYASMVGSCAFDPNGCPVTWADFVNYFYNTVQATLTMDWPTSGDAVLAWWAEIATWTGFCSGTNCVNGQIPYTNLDDWLRFSSEVLITTPGNPPIRDPLSPIRDENEDVWDPVPHGPCPYADSSLCGYDNGPQEPPEPDNASFTTSSVGSKPKFATLSLTRDGTSALVVSSSIADNFLPRNVPPPVYITNGTEHAVVDLNLDGGFPPTRRSFSIGRVIESRDTSLLQHRGPTPLKDTCKGEIETPSPLPILTYYCDYLPKTCANIRSSGLLINDEVILTYDPFGSTKRRNSVCNAANRAILRSAGCDRTQHNPAYWDVSCDEFPFNSALEGGSANGAVTAGVPTQEQSYQSGLQSAVSKLYRIRNDKRSMWSTPGSLKSASPGRCHEYILKLVDSRPAGTSATATGTLYSGGAFIGSNDAGHTMTIEDSRARPPPAPRAPYDYPNDATALKPPGIYRPWNCSPCNQGAPLVPFQEFSNGTVSTPTTAPALAAPSACTKTTTWPTSTPTPTSDAASKADEAAAAAAAAQAALAGANESAAIMSAAKAVVDSAKVAAAAAAAAAGAAIANSPAAMASAISSATYAQYALESALASLTDIFGTGTIPASVASIIEQASIVGSDTASVVVDTWNTKPPQTDLVPPFSDPAHNPSTNFGGGPNVPPAACFGAGSSGQLTVSGGFIWLSTGTSTQGAQMFDAGSPAYFGVNLASDGRAYLGSLCSGVYAWFSGEAQPSFQVECSSHEFGSYWNTAKQQCYVFPISTEGYNIVCGNSAGMVYSCLQSQGYTTQLTPVSFAWS